MGTHTARTADVEAVDAVVVGGGPAGSTAAAVLARNGLRVVVCERKVFPRFHIGESMLTYTAAALHQLGVHDAIAAGGFVTKTGAEFSRGDGSFTRVDFRAQGGGRLEQTFQVERSAFDDLLADHARHCGADVREDASVREVLTDPDGRLTGVRYGHGDGVRELRAPYVVDASGRAGVVAHQLLRTRRPNPRLQMVATYRHYVDVDEATNPGTYGDIQINSHPDGWVWAIPIRDGKLSVGAVTPAPRIRELGPDEVFARDTRAADRIHPRIAHATPVGDLRGESGFNYFTETVAGPGWFVVGDAGCFVDPVFSAGVYLAVITGRAAGQAITELRATPAAEDAVQQRYARLYKTGYDAYFRLIYGFYEHDFSIGRLLKRTGAQVEERWVARLLSGDFWSRHNPLTQYLRTRDDYATFAPFAFHHECPVYPEVDAAEGAAGPRSLGAPLASTGGR